MAKDSSTFLFTKVKEVAHNIKELDKKWAKKIQEKFKLTDYQMLVLAFGKGFIIGAILL
jgi:hypothetical protein|tara:strand:- start:53 stop:229 length:177 start_codon:yes stop_codon:yes gene_type:complete